MNLILALLGILTISYLLVYLGKKIKIPGVVVLIFIGLLFNLSFLQMSFIEGNKEILLLLGNVGLFCLMFLAGLETSWRQLYSERKNSMLIAVFASVLPFVLGLSVFMLLGFSFSVAAIVGVGMSITAEATKARVLVDLNKIKTKLGAAMMGAGIIDDIIGLLLFLVITLSAGICSKENLVTVGVIGSFFAGVIVYRKIGRKTRVVKIAEKSLLFLVVPFFFISMGIHFDFNSLILNPWFLLIIIFIAIIGKIGGVFITKRWTHFNSRQLLLIGWAMNSRGAVELAIALVAFNFGILPVELYSGLVVMALVTTLIFPFIITRIIKKTPKIMNDGK